MMKKIAMIVITISIIMICLAFILPVISQVDNSTVNGTEYEGTYNTVTTISGISYQIMQIFPLVLIVGGLTLVIASLVAMRKRGGMKRKHQNRNRGW